MRQSSLIAMLASQLIAVSSFAVAAPKAVCDKVRSSGEASVTAAYADSCDKIVASGKFDAEATSVCMTIVVFGGPISSLENTVKCMEVVRDQRFNKGVANMCGGVLVAENYRDRRIKEYMSLDCLYHNSADIHTGARRVLGTVKGACPEGDASCLSNLSNLKSELAQKYNCHSDIGASGASYSVSSFDCKIMEHSSEKGLCPQGTEAKGVADILKVCIPVQAQQAAPSTPASAIQ